MWVRHDKKLTAQVCGELHCIFPMTRKICVLSTVSLSKAAFSLQRRFQRMTFWGESVTDLYRLCQCCLFTARCNAERGYRSRWL